MIHQQCDSSNYRSDCDDEEGGGGEEELEIIDRGSDNIIVITTIF